VQYILELGCDEDVFSRNTAIPDGFPNRLFVPVSIGLGEARLHEHVSLALEGGCMANRIEMSVPHVQGVTDHLVRGRIVGFNSFEHPAAEPDERDLGSGIEGRRLGRHTAVVVEVSEQINRASARCTDVKVTP
jgi:hypothetical protein